MAGVFGLSDFRVEQLEGNVEESANYGYISGGSASINTIDRIDFSNETTSAPGNNLDGGRSFHASVFSSNYGYFAGGSPYTDSVERIEFLNETISSPGKNLTQSRGYLAAVSSSTYGYFGGGYRVPSPIPDNTFCTIDRLDFSNETLAVPPVGKQLPLSVNTFTGVSASNYGYFAGGWTDIDDISRIDFSNETTSSLLATLTQGRYNVGTVSSPNYGYFGGGGSSSPPVLDTIDKIDFFNETVSLTGSSLPETRGYLSGTTSLNYGYFATGYDGSLAVNTVDRIDFSNDTTSAPNNNLPQARWATSAISGGKSINAKGFKKHRTDIDSNPISKSYGYFAGGFAPPNVCTIDRLDFSSETVAVPPVGNQLPDARNAHAGLSNPNYGYFGGGSSPGDVATIDRIDFSNETTSAPGNNLSTARWGLTAVFSSNYGYFVGGTDYTGKVDRIDFSTEITSAPGNNLGQGNFLLGSLSNSNYGYFAGGRNPLASPQYSATINRIDYNNETVSQPGNNLPEGRQGLGGVSDNANYGYFGGGGDPSVVATVDRIDFSTTTITPSGNLSQSRTGTATVSNSSYGYFGGGFTPSIVVTVDRIDFSTGTPGPAVGSLSQARYQLAAVSN